MFIFRTQIKIFLRKSDSFLTLHRPQCNWHFQDLITFQLCIDRNATDTFKTQKGIKDIIKLVNVTSVQPSFYDEDEGWHRREEMVE